MKNTERNFNDMEIYYYEIFYLIEDNQDYNKGPRLIKKNG